MSGDAHVGRLGGAGQTEVQNLRAARRQHDVGGLQIPVDDPPAVRRGERVRQGDAGIHERRHVERPAREPFVECLSFQQLHDEIRHWLGAHVVDGADAGMVERGNGLGLALEALERVGRARIGGQHLDGHDAVQPRVARAIHLPHAARAEGAEDLVGTEARAGGKGHCARIIRAFSTPACPVERRGNRVRRMRTARVARCHRRHGPCTGPYR